jgi:hypothetical protein
VAPEVEAFFRQWGGGVEELPVHGRLWKPVNEDDQLKLWSLETTLSEATNYNVHRTGTVLLDDLNGYGVNLSFIRLVGASNEDGRSFIVESVMSDSEISRLSQRIHKAGEQFVMSYIQPVDIMCYVGTVDYSKAPGALGDGI